MPRLSTMLAAALLALPAAHEASASGGDCVVLLHGLGRSGASFLVMEEMLTAVGLSPLPWGPEMCHHLRDRPAEGSPR